MSSERADRAAAGSSADLKAVALEWTRLGCVGFGGPPAHIALPQGLCVEQRGWLPDEELRGCDRDDEPARAFLDGAGPAAVGAIVGSAIPLALALTKPWLFVVLVFHTRFTTR